MAYKIWHSLDKRDEKSRENDSHNEVFTTDLQSVVLYPKSNVSFLYYKTKLIAHNFTIYDPKLQQRTNQSLIFNDFHPFFRKPRETIFIGR